MPPETLPTRQSHSLITIKNYLIAYNGLCLVLWGTITLRAILLIPTLLAHEMLFGLPGAIQFLLKFTQTLALLEVANAIFGLVRANPLTTAMQVASRILVVWGVVGAFPSIIATTKTFGPRTTNVAGTKMGPIAYAGIVIAWGVTECIRYGFFVDKEGLGQGRVPSWLTWLRYNTFLVLYPLGISSECCLMYLALEPAQEAYPAYNLFLKAVMLIYVPGSYILYTHMMAQRRRIMKGKAKDF